MSSRSSPLGPWCTAAGRAVEIPSADCVVALRVYDATMVIVVVVALGVVASVVSFLMVAPSSRDLVVKLGTLIDMTKEANPELYGERILPITPFVKGAFVHKRLTKILKADLSSFGELCLRLQRDARKLDRRAHIGMLPFGAYAIGAALWFFLG